MKYTILTFTLLLSVFFVAAQTKDNGPKVVFGTLTHEGPYDRSEILLQEKLVVSAENESQYKIISYHLTISPVMGKPIRFEVIGTKFTAKLQGSLNQIVPGDKILIESIMVMVNDDPFDFIELEPLTLLVKTFKQEGPYEPAYPLMKESYPVTTEPILMDSFLRATFGDFDLSVPHSKEDIIKQKQVGVYSKEGLKYTIQSFKMIVAFKSDPPLMASSNSNQLTSNMKEVLTRVKSGDRILIEGIRAEGEIEGKTYKANLSPIIITVL